MGSESKGLRGTLLYGAFVVVAMLACGAAGVLLAFPELLPELGLTAKDARQQRVGRERAPSVLHGVDLRQVHGRLLTDWWVQRNQPRGGGARGQQATAAVRAALAPDPELLAVFDGMDGVLKEDAWARSADFMDLGDRWNAHVAEAGWVIDPAVMRRGQRVQAYIKAYEVLADVQVDVAGPRRVQLLRRVDGSNVVESHLGHSGDGEAAVLTLDRLTDFVADTLWPVLDADAGASKDAVLAAFAGPVRAELAAGLSDASFALLAETAPHRRELLAVQASVDARKHCSRGVFFIDWLGMSERGVASARALAKEQKAERSLCPVVTPDEVDRMARASKALAKTDGIEDAVGELLAWGSRKTAVHEARHVADGAVAGADAPVPCPGCPPDFPPAARAELSAYLATLAEPSMAHTALLQACRVARGGQSRPHLAALDLLGEALDLRGCTEGPPADLAARAAALELELFGRSDRAALPADYPTWIEPASGLNRVD
jgi:hypothetical protein